MDETTKNLGERMDKLENSSKALGENSHRELKMLEIDKAKHGVKILSMRDKATEINAKMYITNRLSLTKIALANMGVQQVFRLGKHPTQESDGCPPVIIIFTTKYMVETILNAARSEGLGGIFKEHIAETYSKAHMQFMQIGWYLKERDQMSFRLNFEEHSLHLQVKEPESDTYRVIKIFTPKATPNTITELDEIKQDDPIQPREEDTRKITIILGPVKLDEDDETKVPGEILEEMTGTEKEAIKEAFKNNVVRQSAYRIIVTCRTRKEAVLLGKWKGIKGTYTQNPLPDCFTDKTWNTQQN